MKRFAAILWVAVGVAVLSTAARADVAVDLVLSSSLVAEETEGPPFKGDKTLYLYVSGGLVDVEFGFVGDLEVVQLDLQPGHVNTGTLESPVISATSGCISDTSYVAAVVVRDSSGDGGHLCFGYSTQNSRSCWRPCGGSDPDEWYWFTSQRGYRTDGTSACGVYDAACLSPLSVDSSTWGRVKAGYR
ncbi:MAG: hypothetical protein DHS20C21_03440 [Gemmatimonadota bacterium]|nr:MAG: hypothetical protein DHS20C21_03440 [Gemmatimonadota bacterium]